MTLHINTPPPEQTAETPLVLWGWSRQGRLTVSLALTVFLITPGLLTEGRVNVPVLTPITVACAVTIVLITMRRLRRKGYLLAAVFGLPAALALALLAGWAVLLGLTDWGASPFAKENNRLSRRFAAAAVLQVPVALMGIFGVKQMNAERRETSGAHSDRT